jgi:hypothetical protein
VSEQRREREASRQDLAASRQVGDDLGVHGVGGEQAGAAHAHGGARAERPEQRQHQQGAERVQREVRGMENERRARADRVIEGVGEMRQRPVQTRDPVRPPVVRAEVGEGAERSRVFGVVAHEARVVENEPAAQASREDDHGEG